LKVVLSDNFIPLKDQNSVGGIQYHKVQFDSWVAH